MSSVLGSMCARLPEKACETMAAELDDADFGVLITTMRASELGDGRAPGSTYRAGDACVPAHMFVMVIN